MSSSGLTRHTSKNPSLTLAIDAQAVGEQLSSSRTPPTSAIDTEPLYTMSPKSPKSDVGRSKSQSRRILGNWQLGKTIGQGSMGRVRLGYHTTTGEQVRPLRFPFLLTLCRSPSKSSLELPRNPYTHIQKGRTPPRVQRMRTEKFARFGRLQLSHCFDIHISVGCEM